MSEMRHLHDGDERLGDERQVPAEPERVAAGLAPAPMIVASLPDDFDIEAVFKSERELGLSSEPAAIETRPDTHAEPLAEQPVTGTVPETGSMGSETSTPIRPQVPVLVADLIDNHVRLEWHEAVAMVRRLCAALDHVADAKARRPLIEPWSIQITDHGDLAVLPGATGGDPVVKQVGRLLNALLQESIAPAELRLVASQASFELPVYGSVEELSTALKRFERSGDTDAIRQAFSRALDAKYAINVTRPPQQTSSASQSATPGRRWLPKALPPATLAIGPETKSHSWGRVVVGVAAAIVAVVATAWILWLPTSPDPTAEAPVSRTATLFGTAAPVQGPTAASAGQPSAGMAAAAAVGPTRVPEHVQRKSTPAGASSRVSPSSSGVTSSRTGPASRNPSETIRIVGADAAPRPRVASAASDSPASMRQSDDPLLAAERRASDLLAAGKSVDAAIVYDSIVMRDPAHQLDSAHSTPEAMEGLRHSKQTLLPTLARSHYAAGRSALDTGDFALAIAEAGRALRMLGDPDLDGGAVAALKASALDLLSTASTAQRANEEAVYTINDLDVTPPRPVGRQLPAAGSLPQPSSTIGRLEILVGRTGAVERVTLHTPTNAFQERMIVSAAKAWRYRPAIKNGKPVRFSLMLSITLPGVE